MAETTEAVKILCKETKWDQYTKYSPPQNVVMEKVKPSKKSKKDQKIYKWCH